MKKILFVIAFIVAVSFSSCANKTTPEAETIETEVQAVDSSVVEAVEIADTVAIK